MAQFKFRLARILKLRERAEQDASRVLGRILSLKQACLNKIESIFMMFLIVGIFIFTECEL